MNVSQINYTPIPYFKNIKKQNQKHATSENLNFLPCAPCDAKYLINKNDISFGALFDNSAEIKNAQSNIKDTENRANENGIDLSLFWEYQTVILDKKHIRESENRLKALNSLLDSKLIKLESVKNEFQGIAMLLYKNYNKGEKVARLSEFLEFIISDEAENVYKNKSVQQKMGEIIDSCIEKSPKEKIKLIRYISNHEELLNKDIDLGQILVNVDEKTYGKTVLNLSRPESLKKINTDTNTKSVKSKVQGTYPKKDNKEDNKELKGFLRVGGQKQAIDLLKKNFIYPKKYPNLYKGIKQEKGAILYGPPGTGKTLMAQALSEECGAYFIGIGSSEMSNKYVGETEENWRNLFEDLKKHQPSFLFVDEIDALCRARGNGDTHGDEQLNQFLKLVSDVKTENTDIVIIGATNNFNALDKAVIRKGRLGLHIEMPAPKTIEEVEEIFNIHSLNVKIDEDVESNKTDLFQKMLDLKLTGSSIEAIVKMAHNKALDRMDLFEKMENGTVTEADEENLSIKTEDFLKVLEEEKQKQKQGKLGF